MRFVGSSNLLTTNSLNPYKTVIIQKSNLTQPNIKLLILQKFKYNLVITSVVLNLDTGRAQIGANVGKSKSEQRTSFDLMQFIFCC